MGLGGVAIAVLPSMIYPKQPFSDGLGGVKTIEGRFSKIDIICPYTYYHNTSDTPQK